MELGLHRVMGALKACGARTPAVQTTGPQDVDILQARHTERVRCFAN